MTRHRVAGWLLRLGVAAALAIDAAIHLKLAGQFQAAAPGGIGEGTLFRVEAGIAVVAALYVLIRGSRTAYAAALLVSASALGVVLVYRYAPVPAIGPIRGNPPPSSPPAPAGRRPPPEPLLHGRGSPGHSWLLAIPRRR